MNDMLLLWLSLSLSGSLVALALILLKPLLRRFSKTWQYYIWLLVVLRLLIPFSPDVSVVGGLFQRVEMQLAVQIEPAEKVPEIHFSEAIQPPASPDFGNTSSQKSPVTMIPFSTLKNHILGAIWLTVAMILLVRKVNGYSQFLKVVKKESKIILDGQLLTALQEVSTAMGIKKTISVCTNPLVQAPMLIGYRKPMVVMPNETMPYAELMFVLRHELTHYRRMDILYKWLAEIAVCLHWFNPFAYWVRKKISQDCEFSCDEKVVSGLESDERQTYGETLLNSIVINSLSGSDFVSLSLNKDGKLIKERLNAIMKYHRKPKWIVGAAAVLTSVLLCGTVFVGAYPVVSAENVNTNQSMQSKSDPTQSYTTTAQTVVYENVELRRNDDKTEFDYISAVRANHTAQKIVNCDRAMLAYDKEGNPLELDWWARDDELNYRFLGRHNGFTREVLPGQKDEQFKGWKLNAALDPQVQKVAYVLFCDTKIIFEDGTAWENPNYEQWLSTYEGKKISLKGLENYYPYEEKIMLNQKAGTSPAVSSTDNVKASFSGVSVTGQGPVGVELVKSRNSNVTFELLNMDNEKNCMTKAAIVNGTMQITINNDAPNGINVDFGSNYKNVVRVYIPDAVYTKFDIKSTEMVIKMQDFNAPIHVESNKAGFWLIDTIISQGTYNIDVSSGPIYIEADTILKNINANTDSGPLTVQFNKMPTNLYLDSTNCGPVVERPNSWPSIYEIGSKTPKIVLSNTGKAIIEVQGDHK